MKIAITFDFDDRARRAVTHHSSQRIAPATRAEMRRWIEGIVHSTLQVIVSEMDENPSLDNCEEG